MRAGQAGPGGRALPALAGATLVCSGKAGVPRAGVPPAAVAAVCEAGWRCRLPGMVPCARVAGELCRSPS